MIYQEIKSKLAQADRLALSGKVSEADILIRSMMGNGLAPMDLTNNLSSEALRKLRAFTKKGGAA